MIHGMHKVMAMRDEERDQKNLFCSSVADAVVVVFFYIVSFCKPFVNFQFHLNCLLLGWYCCYCCSYPFIWFSHRKAGAHISHNISATCRYHHHHVPFVHRHTLTYTQQKELHTLGISYFSLYNYFHNIYSVHPFRVHCGMKRANLLRTNYINIIT